MRSQLKKITILVKLSRFGRALSPVWNQVQVDWQHEKDQEALYRAREDAIKQYFGNGETRKLQIGSGGNPLPGWLNSDLEPTNKDVIYLDALYNFPFQDQVFDYVFSEHMIEHINYPGGLFMLAESFRILKPGGKIRIATPDMEKLLGLYGPEKTEAQIRYIEWSAGQNLGLYVPEKSKLQQHRPEWDIPYEHFQKYFPDCRQDSVCFILNNFFRSYGHQFIYDAKTLKGALEAAGFVDVTRFSPGISEDENLQNIESHANLIGDEMNLYETLILEGRRP